jgi:hypothetical protein
MYLGIFNKDTHTHTFTINSLRIATPVSGLLLGKRHASPIMLCMIGATLFLPFTFVFLVLSFMDGNAGYNQIFMAPEDIHKTAF